MAKVIHEHTRLQHTSVNLLRRFRSIIAIRRRRYITALGVAAASSFSTVTLLQTSLRRLIHRLGRSVQTLRASLPSPPSALKRVRIRGYTWTPDISKPSRYYDGRRKKSIKRNNNSEFFRCRVDLIKCVIGSDESGTSADSTPQATIIKDRRKSNTDHDEDIVQNRSWAGQYIMAPGAGDVEATRDGGRREKIKARYRRYRRYIVEPRQEISCCLKYLLFVSNFIFWICGIACTILGIYLYAKDYRAVFEALDFFLNPSILLIVCGCVIFVISFLGCTGSLRENVYMLKLFSLCLFFAYICLVILAFIIFMLFYSDTKTGLSIQSLLHSGVSKYHENDNMRELMDYLQSSLSCCGATSQGYKDWNNNPLYNCSSSNPVPEQCGVPPSCCKINIATPPAVTVGPKGNSGRSNAIFIPASDNDQLPGVASAPNLVNNPRCGFHAQDKSITDLQNTVNTDGCLLPLQRIFEGNAVIIGAVIGAIIVPVCLAVTFSNVLARQIERQRYLLEKEARKEERRRRRNRSKFRDPFAGLASATVNHITSRKRPSNPDVTALQELSSEPAPLPKKDSSTKLIIEDDHQDPEAGPSGVRKNVKVRKPKEPPAAAQALKKRSGNPELPAIPPLSDPRGDNKKRRKGENLAQPRVQRDTPQPAGPGAPNRILGPQKSTPSARLLDPPVSEARRHRNARVNADHRPKNRSKSKDHKQTPYTGPVIVEIESTTHEGPPASNVPLNLEEAILTVEEEVPIVLIERLDSQELDTDPVGNNIRKTSGESMDQKSEAKDSN